MLWDSDGSIATIVGAFSCRIENNSQLNRIRRQCSGQFPVSDACETVYLLIVLFYKGLQFERAQHLAALMQFYEACAATFYEQVVASGSQSCNNVTRSCDLFHGDGGLDINILCLLEIRRAFG